jgi:predicted nicotinamide N-methyase
MGNPVPFEIPSDPVAFIEANTEVQRPPLCPEVQLRLLKGNAPMQYACDKHIFHDEGPRPYWAFCWASGQALARYLLDHPHLVRGLRVLDFGAGSGVAAIAAAKAGAAKAIAADIDPVALAAIQINAQLNQVAVDVSSDSPIEMGSHDWDVLLAADMCYLSWNREWLWSLADESKLVLISDPGRTGLLPEKLDELARYAVRTVPDIELESLKTAVVYRLRTQAADALPSQEPVSE